MKLFCPMTTVLLFMTTSSLFADPIDTSVIHADMDIDECLTTAHETLDSMDFIDITTVDSTVQGNDKKKRYFASIDCESDKGTIFFAVSGPNDKKRAELMQSLLADDDSSSDETTEVTGGDCVIQPDSNDNLWKNCEGQQVTVLGKAPRMVMQHPILAFDFEIPTTKGSDATRTVQSYMDVGDRQIILLAKTDVTCQSELQVKGLLKHIDLGGKSGTKESYQGWSVHVNEFMCF